MPILLLKFLTSLSAGLCFVVSISGVAFGKTISISPNTSIAEINALIETVEDHSVLEFPSGRLVLNGQLIIARDHITLTGSETGESVLQFKFPKNFGADFIQISGSGKSFINRLSADAVTGSKKLITKFGHDLKAGDHVYLARSNTLAYFDSNKWSNLNPDTAISRSFRETIGLVTKTDDKHVTLNTPLPFDFTASQATWQKINMRKGVRLKNITITGALGVPNPLNFQNNYPEFHSKAAIRAFQTSGLQLDNLRFKDVPSKAIAIDRSYDVKLDQIEINGSHNKGVAGNGYGIELREVFNSDLTRLHIKDVRHSVLFSSWHAEVGNLVHIEYTNRDINFHGSPDHSNTVLIDEMVLQYDENVRGGRPRHAWRALSFGGRLHARTNFIADNDISFVKATGGWRNDILPAASKGSYLNGRRGNDFLIGNKGPDYFIGGAGRDWFVPGGNRDVIADFQTGKKGDLLLLEAEYHIENVSDGALITVGEATILLQGVKLETMSPENILICNSACVRKRVEAFESDL